MKIRWIDAMDAFSHGGYIGLETMRYIAPKWFSDLCPENDTGLSERDYEEIRKVPERYLKVPIFTLCGVACRVAIKMGIKHDDLVRMGMNKEEYWATFLPDEYDTTFEFSYDEKSVDKYIDTYMGENGLMYDYLQNRHKMFVENMKIWLLKHKIVPY